jgi:hypothetical protein
MRVYSIRTTAVDSVFLEEDVVDKSKIFQGPIIEAEVAELISITAKL